MKIRNLYIALIIIAGLVLLNAFGNSLDGPIDETKKDFFLRHRHILISEIIALVLMAFTAWKGRKVIRWVSLFLSVLIILQIYLTTQLQYMVKSSHEGAGRLQKENADYDSREK